MQTDHKLHTIPIPSPLNGVNTHAIKYCSTAKGSISVCTFRNGCENIQKQRKQVTYTTTRRKCIKLIDLIAN